METKFQTSFIPKKPSSSAFGGTSSVIGVSSNSKKSVIPSLYMTLSTIVFVVSLLGAGGVYGYQYYLKNQSVTLKDQLAKKEKSFNFDTIDKLKIANQKLLLSRQVLDNHVAVSQIFDTVQKLTTVQTRFLSMDLTMPDKGASDIKIALQGYGANRPVVAYQSDVLNNLDQFGLRSIVKNPILSDPTNNSDGTVSFTLSAVINPSSLTYKNLISPPTNNNSTSSSSDHTGASSDVPPTQNDNNPFINQ